MMKLDKSTFTSIVFVGLMLVVAGMAASWVSGQSGTIPTELAPGEIVAVADEPGRFVGITDKNGVRTVVLDRSATIVAQTYSDDGTTVMEGIDAFAVENGDNALLPPFVLSPYSLSLVTSIIAEIEAGTRASIGVDGSGNPAYPVKPNEIDVMCLTADGSWTGLETRSTIITVSRVESILNPGTYVQELAVNIDLKITQHGVCGVFINGNNFENVNIQDRADIEAIVLPAIGGVSGDS